MIVEQSQIDRPRESLVLRAGSQGIEHDGIAHGMRLFFPTAELIDAKEKSDHAQTHADAPQPPQPLRRALIGCFHHGENRCGCRQNVPLRQAQQRGHEQEKQQRKANQAFTAVAGSTFQPPDQRDRGERKHTGVEEKGIHDLVSSFGSAMSWRMRVISSAESF